MRSPSTQPPKTGEYAGPPMIWFTWCMSKRYSPAPARLAPGVRASVMSFSIPVADLLVAPIDEPHVLGETRDLAAVRVLAHLGRGLRAHGEIPELRAAGVDDLVRRLRPAGRAGDDVAGADREGLGSDADLAPALDDEEHLLLHAVAVEWIRALPRRHRGQVVAELLRADLRRDHADARFETLGRGAGRRVLRRPRLQLDLGDIDDVLRHRYSFSAAFTFGITCSTISSIERLASCGST